MFLIYTKPGCKYCKLAIEFIINHKIDDFTERTLDPETNPKLYQENLSELKILTNFQHHTFPFIFRDGKFIGGHDDLVASHMTIQGDDF